MFSNTDLRWKVSESTAKTKLKKDEIWRRGVASAEIYRILIEIKVTRWCWVKRISS
jgi:hypothetical protein